MTTKDIMDLTIPQLEYILEGCAKNNKELEDTYKNGGNGKPMEGADAIKYLIQSGDIK